MAISDKEHKPMDHSEMTLPDRIARAQRQHAAEQEAVDDRFEEIDVHPLKPL